MRYTCTSYTRYRYITHTRPSPAPLLWNIGSWISLLNCVYRQLINILTNFQLTFQCLPSSLMFFVVVESRPSLFPFSIKILYITLLRLLVFESRVSCPGTGWRLLQRPDCSPWNIPNLSQDTPSTRTVDHDQEFHPLTMLLHPRYWQPLWRVTYVEDDTLSWRRRPHFFVRTHYVSPCPSFVLPRPRKKDEVRKSKRSHVGEPSRIVPRTSLSLVHQTFWRRG